MDLGILLSLPVLIGQWVGILGLRKTERNMAWWFMMVGICFTTLGLIISATFFGLIEFGQSSLLSSPSFRTCSTLELSGLCGLGSLLFAIGFAIHGQLASKGHQRICELESIAAAQSEELNILRSS
jgi:hypothetical protein